MKQSQWSISVLVWALTPYKFRSGQERAKNLKYIFKNYHMFQMKHSVELLFHKRYLQKRNFAII